MMTPARSIAELTQQQVARYVNDGFKQYHSVLLLSRSPLADSDLVTPTLVRDEVSPSADDRGNGLRLVLRWAVEQLAPGDVAHPIGTFRPYHDPTWQEPAWWRYNILRHRYIEPLHPDEFVEGGRYTETLMALTGIPSKHVYFEERNRAIAEVAQWLRRQFAHGDATEAVQRLALEAHYRPLSQRPDAERLIGIAATFSAVFPRPLLNEMARREGLVETESMLDDLVAERYLLVDDDGESLWLSPVLRAYAYQRQSQARRRARHQHAAAYFADAGDPLAAIYHLQQAEQNEAAAALTLSAAPDLLAELGAEELAEAILRFDRETVAAATWCELQILLSDLYLNLSRLDAAMMACRQALPAAPDDLRRGRVLRRMGKIYEQRNQLHALNYYAQAHDYLPRTHPEYVEMLKDRGWIQIERQAWGAAREDLETALALAADQNPETRARIHDAFASLSRYEKAYDTALTHARQALMLRERAGNPFDIAKSMNNLGILYAAMGHHIEAVSAHEEAIAAFAQIGNQEHMAAALLNAGTASHFGGDLPTAVDYYRRSLALSANSDWPLTESRAHANLVEALLELDDLEHARRHWRLGVAASSQAALADELAYYETLAEQTPALRSPSKPHSTAAVPNFDPTTDRTEQPVHPVVSDPAQTQDVRTASSGERVNCEIAGATLGYEERQALWLVERTGKVTASDLMEEAQISKATATRKLASLAASGHLQRMGKGRGTHYVRGHDPPGHGPKRDRPTVRAQQAAEALSRQRALLAARYAVADIAILEDEAIDLDTPDDPGATAAHAPTLTLVVRYHRLPDLLAFFELERFLAELTGMAIRLKPEETLRQTGPVAVEKALRWQWNTEYTHADS